MNLLEKIKLIERVDALIRRKATGTPSQLSKKLGISKRNVFNLINTMKEMGAPISFCKNTNNYCYEEMVAFTFGFISKKQQIISLPLF
ncbi:MAG: hypothetical protein JKY48_13300 [Flavobacteriales bacterium]|nr:hypothetical protein [Flavobacteriales bacterium]